MTDIELAWLAGLLEGEGSFIEFLETRNKKWRCKIYLKMTDLDIIERVQYLTGMGSICTAESPSKPSHYKKAWQWQVQSIPEAIKLMEMLLPLMGQRRSEKITTILEYYYKQKDGE